jgi:hypothetical protein
MVTFGLFNPAPRSVVSLGHYPPFMLFFATCLRRR